MEQVFSPDMPTINPNNELFAHKYPAQFKELLNNLKKIGTPVNVKKGDIIIDQGKLCNFFFFVESGIYRVFRLFEGNEITYGFTFRGDIDTCPMSFFNQTPANDTIESLTDGVIVKVSRSEYETILKENKELTDVTTYFLNYYLDVVIARLVSQKALTAEEQYISLLNKQSDEICRIPLKYIASYLGISPARLSRIRKKI